MPRYGIRARLIFPFPGGIYAFWGGFFDIKGILLWLPLPESRYGERVSLKTRFRNLAKWDENDPALYGEYSYDMEDPAFIIPSLIYNTSTAGIEIAKNNQAELTALTVTINSTGYAITFANDKTATVVIPFSETIPSQITVKTVAISDKATGLEADAELMVTDGKTSFTITAEDGTTAVYRISLALPKVQVQEIAKAKPTTDRRYHYIAFTIQSKDQTTLGRYKIGLKETGETAMAFIASSRALPNEYSWPTPWAPALVRI